MINRIILTVVVAFALITIPPLLMIVGCVEFIWRVAELIVCGIDLIWEG
jgi:ABC-type uncharacterized transport system permease subunit